MRSSKSASLAIHTQQLGECFPRLHREVVYLTGTRHFHLDCMK